MKKLVAIAIAGIAAIAILVYLGRSAEPTSALASNPEQARPPALDVGAESRDTSAQRASIKGKNSHPAAPQLTDEQTIAACITMWTRRAESNKAMLAAEPKDPAWAYPMEQKLREYTSRRFQSSEIDVVSIDCRTYYCEIRAQGFVPEKTGKEFSEVIGAIQSEPWSDFSGMGVSHEEDSGKTFHIGMMSRQRQAPPAREDPEEAQLERKCAAIQSKQQDQRRAKLDAQDRDASWADPMEYRLRQHMTARLAKQPVDHLDISCRTTFCRIQASGRTRDSEQAFQKAAEEAAAQPWANLWLAERAGEAEGENWDASIALYRRN